MLSTDKYILRSFFFLILPFPLQASSQWRKVQDRLEADERCSRLEKIDRLEIFQVMLLIFLPTIKKNDICDSIPTDYSCQSFYFSISQEYLRDLEKEEEEQRKLRMVPLFFFFPF